MSKKLLLLLCSLFILSSTSAATVASPIHHFKMNDDTTNSTITDAMGSANGVYNDSGGAINTDTGSLAGKINKALAFDGGDEYMRVAVVLASGTYSISYWVWFDTMTPGYAAYLYDFREDAGTGYQHYNNSVTSAVPGTEYVNLVETTTVSAGVWLFIVIPNITVESKTAIWFAARWDNDKFSPVKFDDIRIYDFALSEDDRAAIYNDGDGTEDENPEIPTVAAGHVTIGMF